MNNIINIYELLGLIKDGKAPKKIKYENIIWKHNLEENEYIEDGKDYWLFQDYFPNNLNFLDCLNDKVEILEEDKPIIEKLNLENDSPTHFYITNEYGTKCGLTKHSKMIADKLNEVIEFLNRKEDK